MDSEKMVNLPVFKAVNSRLHRPSRVVIIDARASSRRLLEGLARTLEHDVIVNTYHNPIIAFDHILATTPDLIIAEDRMPGINGIEFTRRVRAERSLEAVPLVIISMDEDRSIRYETLEAGANDYLMRPIDPKECHARWINLLTLRRSIKIESVRAESLEDIFALYSKEARLRERETLLRLSMACEYRNDVDNHIRRIAKFAYIIAKELNLSQDECDEIEAAALIHDVGKIGIPDRVRMKNGQLTHEDMMVMRRHPIIGYELLSDSPSRYLQVGAVIALGHHEKYDGTGYPYGLAGENIPLSARIVAVADVFDALTSKRPYKDAISFDEARQHILSESGKHFDPACVEAFERRTRDIQTVMREFSDRG